MRVAIAGGGIAGLSTAIALARRGIASCVYERRAAFPDEGAGIQIGPNGTRILEELGVGARLGRHVGTPEALSVRHGKSGRELARLPLGAWIAARHGAPYWTAHRADLNAALRECAKSERLIETKLDTELNAFVDDESGVWFANMAGTRESYDALIAADGIWSINRRHIAGDATLTPTGKAAYRTVIPAKAYPSALASDAVHIWLMPGAHAVHYPVKGGREFALVVIADDAEGVAKWSAPVAPDFVQAKIAGFAEPLHSLVGAAEAWRKWSLFEMEPLPAWTLGRAALVGDAAHPMLPFLAQGAVMALEDAVTIAKCLSHDGRDARGALATYEDIRRRRVNRVVENSRRNGRIYHLHGLAAAARDATLKFASGKTIMARYDWLYGAQF
jgi:salicylate hydroxylase